MANTQPSVGKKRQVAKLTKRQLGYEIGRNVLNQIANIANGVRDLVEKGRAIDQRTGQPIELRCAPADITRSWSPEQHAAVEEFIATWAIEPEPPPKPPSPTGKRK
jgi:beta-lactamase class A